MRVLCLAFGGSESRPLLVRGCQPLPARDKMAVRLSVGMGVGAEILTAS